MMADPGEGVVLSSIDDVFGDLGEEFGGESVDVVSSGSRPLGGHDGFGFLELGGVVGLRILGDDELAKVLGELVDEVEEVHRFLERGDQGRNGGVDGGQRSERLNGLRLFVCFGGTSTSLDF